MGNKLVYSQEISERSVHVSATVCQFSSLLYRQSTVFRIVFECCLIFGGVGISIKLSSSASSVYYKNIANDTAISFLSFLMWSFKMRWPCIHGQVSGQFHATGTYDAQMEVK